MHERKLQTAYLYSAAGMGVLALSGITTGVLSSRALGAQGRGELTALLLLPALMGRLGNLGLSQSVGYLDSPMRRQPEQMAGAALVAGALTGSFLVLCLLPFLRVLLPQLHPRMLQPAALCLLYIPLNFMFTALLGDYIAAGDFCSYNALQISAALGQMVLMLIFWWIGQASSTSFGIAVILSAALVLLAKLGTLKRLIRQNAITIAGMKQVLSKAWQFTQPELAGLALLRSDVLLLARVVSSEELGLYTVAAAVAVGQALAASPVAQVCFHSTSSREDHGAAIDGMARQFRFLQVVFLAIAVLAIAIAPTIIRLAFGERFTASSRAAIILIVAMAIWSCSQILEGGMRGLDLTKLCSLSNLLGLGALALAAFFLVPAFRIDGMAMAVLAGQSVSLGSKLFLLKRSAPRGLGGFWAFNRPGLNECWITGTVLAEQFFSRFHRKQKEGTVPAL